MVIDINIWLEQYVKVIKELFAGRVIFLGLQGSYGRDEATEDSDIDLVLILDKVGLQDLKAYREAISLMPYRDKICGFISGKQELVNWEKSDLFQFCHDTTPILGSIDFLFPMIGKEDARRAVLIGACNIYHMCGHNFVHEKDLEILKALYKTAFFVLQALYYNDKNIYIKKKTELLPLLSPQEKQILRGGMRIKLQSQIEKAEFEYLSEQLFEWAGEIIAAYKID